MPLAASRAPRLGHELRKLSSLPGALDSNCISNLTAQLSTLRATAGAAALPTSRKLFSNLQPHAVAASAQKSQIMYQPADQGFATYFLAMLADEDRNVKYAEAIKQCIAQFRKLVYKLVGHALEVRTTHATPRNLTAAHI